jgi:radical SAM superfamily enzyme YgiQ (UPF0313 family)
MIDRKMRKKWWMQTSMNAVKDEETIKLAAKAGCMFVFIGFESVNKDVLKDLKKGVNLNTGIENYKNVVKTLHKHGIGVMGGFILGIDYESSDYYREFARYLFHSGIDICQLSLLTPLPGTQLFDKMEEEGRLFHTNFPEDWDKYRMSRIVHRLKGVTEEEVYTGDNYIKKHLYGTLPFAYRMIRGFFSLRNLQTFLGVYRFNRALKKSWMNSYYYKNFGNNLVKQEGQSVQKEISYGEPY